MDVFKEVTDQEVASMANGPANMGEILLAGTRKSPFSKGARFLIGGRRHGSNPAPAWSAVVPRPSAGRCAHRSPAPQPGPGRPPVSQPGSATVPAGWLGGPLLHVAADIFAVDLDGDDALGASRHGFLDLLGGGIAQEGGVIVGKQLVGGGGGGHRSSCRLRGSPPCKKYRTNGPIRQPLSPIYFQPFVPDRTCLKIPDSTQMVTYE